MRKKQVKYTVQCAVNPDHLFDKVYDIKKGTEEIDTSEVEAYCPHCDALVKFEIKGKVAPDIDLLRRFEHLPR